MIGLLARNWWVLALRGVLAILFGLAAIFWPGLTLVALVFLFGAYALIDGIGALLVAVGGGSRVGSRWLLVLEGVVGILAGIAAFIWPGITAFVLLILIAAQAVVTGIFELVAAIRLRREIEGEWLLGLSGVASIIFGVLMFAFPGAGALAVVWLIGAYALVFGVLMLVLAFRVRGWRDRAPTFSDAMGPAPTARAA
jgi:uncharacterized membrane protein HdeD (DUF308 family)